MKRHIAWATVCLFAAFGWVSIAISGPAWLRIVACAMSALTMVVAALEAVAKALSKWADR